MANVAAEQLYIFTLSNTRRFHREWENSMATNGLSILPRDMSHRQHRFKICVRTSLFIVGIFFTRHDQVLLLIKNVYCLINLLVSVAMPDYEIRTD